MPLAENQISREVVDAAYQLHTNLGPGLLESVYEAVLAREFGNRGFSVRRQEAIRFEYQGQRFDEGFRADLIINDLVILELKSVEELHPVYKKQLRTYLKLSGKRLGLLINFGASLIKDGIHRVVLGLPDTDTV